MKKIISIWLLISLFSLSSPIVSKVKAKGVELANTLSIDNYTFLFCGLDDAACNTDTIILLNYNLKSNSATFLHIPRDSYFNSGLGQNKINQVVSGLISKGKTKEEAMDYFVKELSDALGITINGYSAYTMESLRKIIDAVGGLEVDLNFELSIIDDDGNTHKLKKGSNFLDGSTALAFIRHRKSYALGDLSRIDAQKIILSSFIQKLKNNFDLELLIKLLLSGKEGVVTNVDFSEILSLAVKNRGRIIKSDLLFVNLPGEAIISSDGISYYVINKPSSSKLISAIPFMKQKDFDYNAEFNKNNDENFNKIYYSDLIDYKIYSVDDLKKIKLSNK